MATPISRVKQPAAMKTDSQPLIGMRALAMGPAMMAPMGYPIMTIDTARLRRRLGINSDARAGVLPKITPMPSPDTNLIAEKIMTDSLVAIHVTGIREQAQHRQ
jgi:hypothetical protein